MREDFFGTDLSRRTFTAALLWLRKRPSKGEVTPLAYFFDDIIERERPTRGVTGATGATCNFSCRVLFCFWLIFSKSSLTRALAWICAPAICLLFPHTNTIEG